MASFLNIPTLKGVLGVTCFGLLAWGLYASSKKDCQTIRVNDEPLCVDIADTEEEIVLGLSGRSEIGADGMLFLMPIEYRHAFWMKDMHFPIDIVWINASGTITEITYAVAPETYPDKFQPALPAAKVLEVPAGTAKKECVGTVVK